MNTTRLLGDSVGFNSSLASALKDSNFLLEARAKLVTLGLEIITSLQIQPELLSSAEIPREAERGIGRDGPLPVDNLVDAPRWNADIPSQTILRDLKGLQKFGGEDLAGMQGTMLASHGTSSGSRRSRHRTRQSLPI